MADFHSIKKNRGLQIKDTKIQNQELLANLAWRFINSKQDTPWASLLASKYLKQAIENPLQIPNKKVTPPSYGKGY